jgi:hypothetical protein
MRGLTFASPMQKAHFQAGNGPLRSLIKFIDKLEYGAEPLRHRRDG